MKRRRLKVAVGTFLVLVVGLWALSYFSPGPRIDPVTGYSAQPPGHAMALLMPSDAEEYAVITGGRLEWWEYTPWDRKWYRYSQGVALWELFLIGVGLPAATVFGVMAIGERVGRARVQMNRCRTCSYDLTGNMSGVCPECGALLSGKACT